MANNLLIAEANRLLDASFSVTAYTAPTSPMKLSLESVIGTASASGTEDTGGSYARQTLTMGAASAGANASTAAATYTNMPAVTTVAGRVFDANGTPRPAWWGAMTNKTTAAGDTLSFAIGAVTAALA